MPNRRPILVFVTSFYLILCLVVGGVGATSTESGPETTSLTLQDIAGQLSDRLATVADVSVLVSFTQFSNRDGSKNEGELQLEAVLPHLIRATWTKPEIYSGVFFILDSQANQYIEYIPAMAEAHIRPLDQVLDQQTPIQISPEQLFTLPPAENFDLTLVTADTTTDTATVQAVEHASGQTYLITVDTARWFITRIEERNPDGQVVRIAEATDFRINQDLNAASLKRLPPGTIERTYR